MIYLYRLLDLENQLVALEASRPSVPPALKFKVRLFFLVYVACNYHNVVLQIVSKSIFLFVKNVCLLLPSSLTKWNQSDMWIKEVLCTQNCDNKVECVLFVFWFSSWIGGKLFLYGFSLGRVFGTERDPSRHQLPSRPHLTHLHLQPALQCLPPHRPCGRCRSFSLTLLEGQSSCLYSSSACSSLNCCV